MKKIQVMCENCRIHVATTTWHGDGGFLSLTHGGGVSWCECCTIKAQLEYAKMMADRVKELEQQLKKVRCRKVKP